MDPKEVMETKPDHPVPPKDMQSLLAAMAGGQKV